MKKFNKLFTLLLAGTLLVGCANDKKETVSASVSNGDTSIATSGKEKTETLEDLYKTLYSDSKVMDNVFEAIARTELLKDYMTEEELNAVIEERRQEILEVNIDKAEYKDASLTNGVISLFNEKLLVRDLRLDGFDIPCTNNVYGPEINADYSYKEGKVFKCDYTEYFEGKVDNAILQHLLIEKYIKTEKENTLDKNKTVKVKYIAIPTADYNVIVEVDPTITYDELEAGVTPAVGHYAKESDTYVEITNENSATYIGGTYSGKYYERVETPNYEKQTARTKQFMFEAVKDLVAGGTLEDIEAKWEENKKEVEQYTYDNACPFDTSKLDGSGSTHASSEEACSAYTNNGAYADYIGLALKLHEIEKTEYVHEEVIDSSATILNADIVASLFSENVEEKLHTLSEGSNVKYLVSSSVAVGNKYSANDIIVNDSSSSYYYIIQVETISSELDDEVAAEAALKDEGAYYLAEKNSKIISAALEFYLSKYDIKVHDEAFYDYLDANYPKIEFDY